MLTISLLLGRHLRPILKSQHGSMQDSCPTRHRKHSCVPLDNNHTLILLLVPTYQLADAAIRSVVAAVIVSHSSLQLGSVQRCLLYHVSCDKCMAVM